MQEITVGMSDVKFAKGEIQLVTYALGSCVGICMYDKTAQVGGMLHAMLPCSDTYGAKGKIEKYVNTGIVHLYESLCSIGAEPSRLKVKMIGGAKMFNFATMGKKPDIGISNIIEARKCLASLRIPIVAEATGGEVGRTVWFSIPDCSVKIKTTRNEVVLL